MAHISAPGEVPVDYATLKCNLDLTWVMNHLLVPHLPTLIASGSRTTVANRQTLGTFLYGYAYIYILDQSYKCAPSIK